MLSSQFPVYIIFLYIFFTCLVNIVSCQHEGHDHGSETTGETITGLTGEFLPPEILFNRSSDVSSVELSEVFIHSIGYGGVRTELECGSGSVAESFFRDKEIVIDFDSGSDTPSIDDDVVSISPVFPQCSTTTSWQRVSENQLVRTCSTYYLSLTLQYQLDEATKAFKEIGLLSTITNTSPFGYCTSMHLREPVADPGTTKEVIPAWKTWVYASVAVLISCIVSLIGIISVYISSRWILISVADITNYLLALAAGTFIGSVVFSLLPETVHEIGKFDKDIGAIVLGGILFGVLSETVVHNYLHHHNNHGQRTHNHNHNHNKSDQLQLSTVSTPILINSAAATTNNINTTNQPDTTVTFHEELHNGNSNDNSTISSSKSDLMREVEEKHRTDKYSAAVMSLIADALHNFVDGALLGATFLVSTRVGWSTCLAVALHELPQEVSDFYVLLNGGISPLKAALLNFLCACSAFIGMIIAIAVGTSFATEVVYIFPFTAGLFLYLALASLFPQFLKSFTSFRQQFLIWLCFSIGIAAMALLLLLPHDHTLEEANAPPGTDPHAGHNH